MTTQPIITIDPQDDAPPPAAPIAKPAQVCMICSGPAKAAPRVDTGTALIVGATLIVALLVWGARRVMRDEVSGAAMDRDTLAATRRANTATIQAGLVVRP